LEDALEAPLEVGELFLAGRGLTDFPMEVFQLVNLRVLDLSQNLIRVLPEGIGGLAQLTVLNLRNNQLRALPVEIGQLQGLQRLDLEENQLAELPLELALCDGLRSLRLNDNCFAVWPAAALSPRIENLTMGYNQLKGLPESIRHLHALTYLDLRHNRLATLPENLALIEGLETVLLEGNPLALSVESVNPEGVLERFFKELHQQQGKSSRPKFPAIVRRCWLRMLMGSENLLADFTLDLCVAALDAPLSVVREAARAVLPVLVPSPLPKAGPAQIVFVGQFPGISKVEVERALAAADIVVLRRLSGDASVIVVLGERPGDAVRARALSEGNPLAFEGHLVNWLAASKGEYLKAAPAANPMQENLGRLIRSYRKENIEIALMMMAKGGTSSGLLRTSSPCACFMGTKKCGKRRTRPSRSSQTRL
jgi:hypothetical protein